MTIRVRVVPRSAKSEIAGKLADGTLKVKVAAPPEKGKAKEELRRVVAAYRGVPASAVTVISGHTSPLKVVRIIQPAGPRRA